jgi:hypothetical protein
MATLETLAIHSAAGNRVVAANARAGETTMAVCPDATWT